MQVGLRRIYVAVRGSDCVSYGNPLVAAYPNLPKELVELFPTLTFACHFVEECDGIDQTETYAAR